MYVRDGKRMMEHEEGAAFFEPLKAIDPSSGFLPDVPELGTRMMGLRPSQLTHGHVMGMGADGDPSSIPVVAAAIPATAPPDHVPWLFGIGAAIGGFILFSGKRRR